MFQDTLPGGLQGRFLPFGFSGYESTFKTLDWHRKTIHELVRGHDQVAGSFRARGEASVEAIERIAATTANTEASEKAKARSMSPT